MDAVNEATELVAKSIGAESKNLHFCSGATEANNIVLKGRWLNSKHKNKKIAIITSPTEHGSIIECAESIVKYDSNVEIIWIKVNKDGTIDLKHLDNILKLCKGYLDVLMVSIMMANNEIGTIHDVKKIGELCKKYEVFFHTDATQALGKMPIDVKELKVDAMSISSHKIYGPKGIGALYISDALADFIDPLLDGGYQNTYTSGTHNVTGMIGMAAACKYIDFTELDRIKKLRDKLMQSLVLNIDGSTINGTMKNRLCNNLNISIDGVSSEVIIMGMDDVIVSSGSACKSRGHEVSHVLDAIGAKNPDCAVRFGLGRWTTEKDIDYASERIIKLVKSIRRK